MRKICVVITARPSYSRVRSLLIAIRAHHDLELQIVVAASALLSRYGSTIATIEGEGFQVDRSVYTIMEGENLLTSAKSTGIGLSELATAFNDLKPDVVVTVADRYETIATAIAASYQNIPLAHIQGGEVTGSIDEKVRHAVTKLADIHFVATKNAAERVIKLGERSETVFLTGCPSIDVVHNALADSSYELDIFKQYSGVGPIFDLTSGYIIAIQHPVTTQYVDARSHIEQTLKAIVEFGRPTLWFWPNVDAGADGTSAGIRSFREIHAPTNIHFFKSMSPEDFIRTLDKCDCIVGNSSVGIRECAYMGVPAVNIGIRQAGRDRGNNVVDSDYDSDSIVAAVSVQTSRGRLNSNDVYGDVGAGARIANLLATVKLSVEKRLTY